MGLDVEDQLQLNNDEGFFRATRVAHTLAEGSYVILHVIARKLYVWVEIFFLHFFEVIPSDTLHCSGCRWVVLFKWFCITMV